MLGISLEDLLEVSSNKKIYTSYGGIMLVELPCGILKDNDIYDHVQVKELTGRQQNYLIDMELVTDSLGHVPRLLEELTSNFQTKEGKPLILPQSEAINLLASEDVECILLKIREATYGPAYAIPVRCPHCSKQQTKKVDLDKIEITKLSNKSVRTKVIQLQKSGIEAEIKLLYLKDLYSLYKALKENPRKLYTGTLYLSLKRLGDNEQVKEEDLLDLPVSDLSAIENAFSELRGSVDTMLTNDCDECSKEFDTPLPVMDPSFFVQSRTPLT